MLTAREKGLEPLAERILAQPDDGDPLAEAAAFIDAEKEVADFLSHLAVTKNVAPSTQNQALNAWVFLYQNVLERPLQEIHGVVRAKKPQKLPVVMTVEEVGRVLGELSGVSK